LSSGGSVIVADHPQQSTVYTALTEDPPFLAFSKAPFFHWTGSTLPSMIAKKFGSSDTFRIDSFLNGRPVETSVYRAETESGWRYFEVSFDPAVGFLPMHCIFMNGLKTSQRTTINERYLVSTTVTPTGEFLPIEWYELFYQLDKIDSQVFDRNITGMCVDTKLLAYKPTADIGHFKASNVRTLNSSHVELKELSEIREISGIGGTTKLQPNVHTLNLEQVRSKIGGKISHDNRPSLTIDQAEIAALNRLARGKRPMNSVVVPVVGGVSAAIICWLVFRKRRQSVWIVFCILSCGCTGRHDKPSKVAVNRALLETRFTVDTVLVEPEVTSLPLVMAIRNAGVFAVRVNRVNGGCTCRKVDQAPLPATLAPGEQVLIRADIQPKLEFESHGYPFELFTDVGEYSTVLNLRAIPRHVLDPKAVTNSTLIEDDGWEFECVHREMAKRGDKFRQTVLVASPDLIVQSVGDVRRGELMADTYYEFIDKTYKVTLTDRAFGLKKGALTLKAATGEKITEIPVIWRRTPFVSSSPDTIRLGNQPVRVFLRCPDPAVELVKVVQAPPGVKALITSERELTVSVTDGVAPTIKSELIVETSTQRARHLVIPIIRYAPHFHASTH
jgi:hypothetical protein